MDQPLAGDARFARRLLIAGGIGAVLVVLAIFAWQHDTFYVSEREPQTAITSYWMLRDGRGPCTAETPIFGPPWRIPFELPLFQYAAAQLSRLGIALDLAGRITSLLLFAACLPVLSSLGRRIGLAAHQRLTLLALAATSPIYLTYGFSYSIESTALLASLLYVERWLAHEQQGAPWRLAAAVATGILAALCKTTTWAVYATVIGLVVVVWTVTELRQRRLLAGRLVSRVLVLAAPLAAGMLWTHHADVVKQANPIAAAALTSSALAAWTLGTLAQRLSPTAWGWFVGRSLLTVMGALAPVAAVAVAVRTVRDGGRSVDLRLMLLTAAGFLVGPAVFTNLYFVHDHYVFASGLFLLLGFVLTCRERAPRLLLVMLVASNLVTLAVYLGLKQVNYDDPLNRHIVAAVRDLPADRPLVILGAYFDAFIPYHSRHKALQARPSSFDDPAFRRAVGLMRAEQVGAVIAKGDRYREIAAATARELGLDGTFQLSQGVWIHYPSQLAARLRLEFLDTHALADASIGDLLAVANAGGSRLIVSLSRAGGPAVLLVHNGNLYLADLKHGCRIVHHRWYLDPTGTVELELVPR